MEDGSHDMFMDLDEDIRFRVVEENFYDTLPTDGVCSLDWNFFPSLTPPNFACSSTKAK